MGKTISGAGALALILCFFLPWITVSCAGRNVATVSGFDMASGITVNALGTTETFEGETVLYLVPVAGIVALGLMFIGGRGNKAAAVLRMLAAVMAAALLFVTWNRIQSEVQQVNLNVSSQIGFLGSTAAAAAIVVGSVFSLGESSGSGADPLSYVGGNDSEWDDW